jgi:predicted lipid carrier protein YhbT
MNPMTLATQWLPQAAGALLQRLPTPLLRSLLMPVLQAVEAQMQDDDWSLMQDRWIEVRCTDLKASWFAVARGRHWQVVPENGWVGIEKPQADVCIQGSSRAFAQLLDAAIDPESLFFQRSLVIHGDTEIGYWFKAMLDRVDRELLPEWVKKSVAGLQRWHGGNGAMAEAGQG